jgi:hypothetical protein
LNFKKLKRSFWLLVVKICKKRKINHLKTEYSLKKKEHMEIEEISVKKKSQNNKQKREFF